MRFDLLIRDWSLKVFSLGVAVIFFLFVNVESATPVDVDFRIEYRLGKDIMITGDAPTVLRATLQGPWASFRSFTISDVEPVTIDLTEAGPGNLVHLVDIKGINPPGGMKVVGVSPSAIELTLDRRVERQVPVSPDIPTRPAFGYEILDVRINPPRVRVVGPMTRMQTLDFISTRALDVNGREDDLSIEVELRPPPSPLRLLDSRVEVLIEIGEEFVQRPFRDLRVRVDNAPHRTRVTPQQVTITLKGPRRIVDNMEKGAVGVFVDALPEVGEGIASFEKPVQVDTELPERVQIVAPVPKVRITTVTKRRRRK